MERISLRKTIILVAIIIVLMLIPGRSRSVERADSIQEVHGVGDLTVTDMIMTLKGHNGFAVFNREQPAENLMLFDARFAFASHHNSWVAFRLRSDAPDKAIWDNQNTYFFIIRENRISLGKVADGQPIEYLVEKSTTLLADGHYHEISLHVTNHPGNGNPLLSISIDDHLVLSYEDTRANDALKYLASPLSAQVYLGSEVSIRMEPDESALFGEMIQRDLPVRDYSSLGPHQESWAILQKTEAGAWQYGKAHLLRKQEGILLRGPGSVVHRDLLKASSLCFDLSIREEPDHQVGEVVVLFYKAERESYFGYNSIGFSFSPDGRIAPVVYREDKEIRFPGTRIEGGFREPRHVVMTWESLADGLELMVYVDSHTHGIRFFLQGMEDILDGKGFLGILNNSLTLTVEADNLQVAGEIEPYAGTRKVLPLYLQAHISQGSLSLLHWEYRPDEPSYYKTVITDNQNQVVGEVLFPENSFPIPLNSIHHHLYLRGVNIDGISSEAVLVHLDPVLESMDDKPMVPIRIQSNPETGAEFYHPATGEPMVISGFNYIRLRFGDHATFEPATGLLQAEYDPYSAETLFMHMQRLQFNTVRIFLCNGRTPGNPGTAGSYGAQAKISADYMDNVVDFLQRAQRYGIYVILCFGENDIPQNQYFLQKVPYANPQDFLFQSQYMEAKLEYLRLVLEYIKNADADLMHTILAVQEQNEFSFNPYLEPFSATSGEYVFFGNKQSYDLSQANSRRDLANHALQHYISRVKQEITSIDSGLLLTIGTSSLRLSGLSYPADKGLFPGLQRNMPLTGLEYLQTDIDFLDLHTYNFFDQGLTARETIEKDMESMLLHTPEALALRKKKPVILGEFGSAKTVQESFIAARFFFIQQRNAALEQGYRGTLLWTFDTFVQTDLYCAMEDNGWFLEQFSMTHPATPRPAPEKDTGALPWLLAIGAVGLGMLLLMIFLKKRTGPSVPETTLSVPGQDILGKAPFVCNFFGEFELYHRGKLLADRGFLSVKAKEMLLYLLHENREVSKEEIMESLWGEKENTNPDNLFHVTLYHLRKSLKTWLPESEFIVCHNRRYAVDAGLFFCIHQLFQETVEDMLNKEIWSEEEVEMVSRQAAYYKNKYLYSYDCLWAEARREYYHLLYAKVLLRLSSEAMSRRQWVTAIKHLEILLQYDPYSEEACCLLLTVYSLQGDRKAAERVYGKYVEGLRQDLGEEPSERIRTLL